MIRGRRAWFGTLAALMLVSACTTAGSAPTTAPSPTLGGPTTPDTSTRSASPSASTTWNTSQSAAIDAVRGYFAAQDRLFAEPSSYTKTEATAALRPYLGQDMLAGNVALFVQLKAAGRHYEGATRLAWVEASGVFGGGAGESVNITVCRDSRSQTLVDAKGKVLSTLPAVIREFDVRSQDSAFRVMGEKEGFGAPCP